MIYTLKDLWKGYLIYFENYLSKSMIKRKDIFIFCIKALTNI